MNFKKIETILFSGVGIAGMFILLVGINYLSGLAKVRVDMTDENVHTLSQGTRNILGKIDGEVEVRFYCTRTENTDVAIKAYADRVYDLLREYEGIAKGNLVVKRFNPEPLSDAEDSAKMDGITPQRAQNGEAVYLGIAVSFLDATETLPVLTPARENLLEYDLSRAISNVINPKKKVVGIMSSLPIMGGPPTPQMMQQGRMQGSDPWVVVSVLEQDFEVKEVETTATVISPKDYDVLMVVHPKDLTDATLFALDQYILHGGKLLVLMDPMPMLDQSGVRQNMMGMNMSSASSLGKLMDSWGVKMDSSKVVADMNATTQLTAGGGQVQSYATWLSLSGDNMDKDDVVMSQVDSLLLPLPGHFTGDPTAGLTKTILFHSSEKSELVERIMAQLSAEQVINEFKSDDKERALAIRLSGKFKTAFPDGAPKAPEAKEGEEPKPGPTDILTESKGENAVTLIADSDFIYDNFSVRQQNFFGQRLMSYLNGNLTMIQSLVEQMAGDSNLIGARSRATDRRPFKVIHDLEAKAREQYQDKLKAQRDKVKDLEKKLSELQQKKSADQQLILSTEQQDEIAKFQKEQAEQQKKLKEIEKDLNKDIKSLENKVTWRNILGMPFLVALLGVVVFNYKRIRTSAR